MDRPFVLFSTGRRPTHLKSFLRPQSQAVESYINWRSGRRTRSVQEKRPMGRREWLSLPLPRT